MKIQFTNKGKTGRRGVDFAFSKVHQQKCYSRENMKRFPLK